GWPLPIRTGPTSTTQVAASMPSDRWSAADEVVLEADLARPIELVPHGFPANFGVFPSDLGAHALRGRLVQLGKLLHHALDTEPLGRLRAPLAPLVDLGGCPGHGADTRMADPVEARRLHAGGEAQALLHDRVDPLPVTGSPREHEEHLVPVAGRRELLG